MAAFKLAKAASGGFKNALMAGVKQGGKKAFETVKGLASKIKGITKAAKNKPDFVKAPKKCGDPVDFCDGSVLVEQIDFEVPGRVALVWERNYSSSWDRVGVCGFGWETPADIRLELLDDGGVSLCGPGLGAVFPHLPTDTENYVLDQLDGARLWAGDGQWEVRTKNGLRYIFARDGQSVGGDSVGGGVLSLVERIEDSNGNHWCFERVDGVLTRIRESGVAGRVLEVESSSEALVESVRLTDPVSGESRILSAFHYEQQDLVGAVDALGEVYGFAYQGHHMVQHTDRLGLSFHYSYDDQWRVVHAWGDGGLLDYSLVYDEVGRESRFTNSLGHTTVITLGEHDLPIREVDPLGAATEYEYDPHSLRTVGIIAPGGLRTSYEYDQHGNLLSTTLPDGSTIRTAYNDDDKPVVVTDPEGGQWRQDWDEKGNLIREATPLGATTSCQYSEQGDLRVVIDPTGQRTGLDYDRLGFLVGMTDAMGLRTEYANDVFGNLLQEQLANGDTTHYRYDAKNRLVESVKTDDRLVRCDYDAEDNLTRYLDEAGRETRFTYNSSGILQSRVDPDGSSVEYHYDTEERLVGVSNQKGQRWHLNRDAVGQLVEEVDYWGQSRKYDYDLSGHLTRSTDPLGQVLAVTCDSLGRITRKQVGEHEAETYQYNKLGQLTQAANLSGVVNRRYNGNGQLAEETIQQIDVETRVDYVYDPAGRLVEQAQCVGWGQETWFRQSQLYSYNVLGLPECVQIDDHEPISLTYDEIGRLTTQTLGQHLSLQTEYNAAGQVSLQASQFKGQLQTQIDYDYDAAGNLVSRDDHLLGADLYRYDPLGQIIAHTDPTGRVRQFVYNKTGDRFKTVQEDEQGRVLHHDDGVSWRLDKAGQLTRRQDAQGQNSYLTWDAFGRLRSYMSDGESVEYAYDALGRRLYKTKTVPDSLVPSEAVWFLWDLDALVGEVKQTIDDPLFAQFYTYHQDSYVPAVMQTQAWEGENTKKSLYTYQNDLNGMPLRLQSENGAIVWEAHYTAHGEIDWLDATLTQPLRLQGQYFDEESGLHYNRYRYYDPGVGCFISQDPIGLLGGNNPYQFASNVLDWLDPLGLACSPKFDMAVNRFRDARGRFVSRAKASQTARISPQKQAGHIRGTPQYANRLKQGKATSSWNSGANPDTLTRQALANGKPVRSARGEVIHGKFQYDFKRPVGTTQSGRVQTSVRVHVDASGAIHGHPVG
jgi:RHS repeat-associated protein